MELLVYPSIYFLWKKRSLAKDGAVAAASGLAA